MDLGVPRWRPFHKHPAALWAVIQHYGIWPTPLLDFSSSWRVAATFAFNLQRDCERAFLYVVGVDRIRSDLMVDDQLEPNSSPFSVRLNAVCPPDARRPHLQDGFLVGRHPLTDDDVVKPATSDASARLVAKLELVNSPERPFWDADFPMLSTESLLPDDASDPLLRDLRACVSRHVDESGLVWVADGRGAG
jgi:hypothetical protein